MHHKPDIGNHESTRNTTPRTEARADRLRQKEETLRWISASAVQRLRAAWSHNKTATPH